LCPLELVASYKVYTDFRSNTHRRYQDMNRRTVEVFTAGCPLCDETVKLVKSLACESCEVVVYDLAAGCETNECRNRAAAYGISRVPAVVVDGKLIGCCVNQQPVTRDALLAAGTGQCCKG
jgi:glutaredoxin